MSNQEISQAVESLRDEMKSMLDKINEQIHTIRLSQSNHDTDIKSVGQMVYDLQTKSQFILDKVGSLNDKSTKASKTDTINKADVYPSAPSFLQGQYEIECKNEDPNKVTPVTDTITKITRNDINLIDFVLAKHPEEFATLEDGARLRRIMTHCWNELYDDERKIITDMRIKFNKEAESKVAELKKETTIKRAKKEPTVAAESADTIDEAPKKRRTTKKETTEDGVEPPKPKPRAPRKSKVTPVAVEEPEPADDVL